VSGEDATATVGVNVQPFVTGIQQLVPSAQDAATKSAKVMSDTYSAEFSKISTIGAAAARQVGGEFGRLGSDINRIIKPLTMIAPELGAIGAAAVVVGGTALAIRGMADAAVSADAELTKLGIHFDPEATANIAAYTKAQKELQIVWDETKVSSGSGIALAMATIDTAFATDIGTIERWLGDAVKVTDQIKAMETAIPRAAGLMASPLSNAVAPGTGGTAPVDMMTTSTMTAAEAQSEYVQSLQDQVKLEPTLAKEINDRIAAIKKTNQEQKIADQIDFAHQQQAAAATKQLTQTYNQLHDAILGPREQIQAEYQQTIDKIEQWKADGADLVLVHKAEAAALDLELRKLHDYDFAQEQMFHHADRAWDDYYAKLDAGLADLKVAVADADRAITKAQIAMYARATEASAASTAQILGNIASVESTEVQSLQNRINMGDELTAAQVRQGNEAIRTQRDLSILQAGISSSLAGLSTYTALTSEFVPPPIAAGIAGGVAISSFAAAVAGIEAGRPAFFKYQGFGADQAAPASGEQIVSAKGGSVDTSHGSDSGVGRAGQGPQAPGGKGNVDRTRGGGQIDFSPEASRLLRWKHRAGKRDPRGRR
jgi:hypothetical protein